MSALQRGDQVRVTFGDGDTITGMVERTTKREVQLMVGTNTKGEPVYMWFPRTLAYDLLTPATVAERSTT